MPDDEPQFALGGMLTEYTDADLGSDGDPVGPAFVAGDGTPYAVIIVSVGAHSGPGYAKQE